MVFQLKIFDMIFGDMVKKNKKFEDFPIFKPSNCPEQKGYSDCGVYTIKHMIHYGEEWWHEVCFSFLNDNLSGHD